MVTLLLDSDRLEVVLSGTEKALSFHKGNVLVPRAQIARAMLTDDAWIWLRGVPNPATAIPSVVAMGTWKSAKGLDFALIRGRRPSVVIDLDGHETYQRLVLTTRHALALVKALRLEGDADATEVGAIVAAAEPDAPSAEAAAEPKPRRARTTKPKPAPAT